LIDNLPFLSSQTSPLVSLGLGNDLDPKLARWMLPGGIGGFLVWAVNAPEAMPLHDLFHQRGPTQVITLVMGGMLVAYLINKWRMLQREQKSYLAFDLEIPTLIRSGDLDEITTRATRSKALVGKRLLRLLGVWSSTGSSFQLERAADSDVELYELSMTSSFSLPKVLLWAIPLMGFIGTVIGMSEAVGSFDSVLSNADNVDGLKNGLLKVTGGLGTAFDTTFLALMISVILAFPLNAVERNEDRLLSQIDGVVREAVMALSPIGDGEIGSESNMQARDASLSTTAPQLDGEDLGALISDAFEKHLPDPSVLVEPAQVYAEQLTQAALDKLTPLTNLVRDSVEGMSEARLSLQDQSEVIRTSMNGLSDELQQSLNELEPLLNKIASSSRQVRTDSESLDQLQAMTELRQSMEALNMNLNRLLPQRRPLWPWRSRGKG
jgi:biopolymer transport protein ExbB/TolQ